MNPNGNPEPTPDHATVDAAVKPAKPKGKPRAIPEQFRPGWLRALDQRYKSSIIVREMLDELHVALGGTEALSPQQRMLCERAIWIHVRLQQMEQEFAAGQGLDTGEYTQLIGSLTNVLRLLGLHRRSKPVETLSSYAQRVAQAANQ